MWSDKTIARHIHRQPGEQHQVSHVLLKQHHNKFTFVIWALNTKPQSPKTLCKQARDSQHEHVKSQQRLFCSQLFLVYTLYFLVYKKRERQQQYLVINMNMMETVSITLTVISNNKDTQLQCTCFQTKEIVYGRQPYINEHKQHKISQFLYYETIIYQDSLHFCHDVFLP